jgi:acyl-CoA reductase-like NAD-dependent aldehyde dehydrogenase
MQLDDIVKRSVNKGAKIVIGGRIPSMKGFFYEPTIMTNITENMPVLKEETFGPVAPVIPVKNEDEAIRIANSTEYGLGASIWTSDIEKAQKLAKRIEAGFVAINSQVKSDPRLPFGGVKRSGYGRELSRHALREFANVKTVVVK